MKTLLIVLSKTNYFPYIVLAFSAVLYILGIQALMQVAHVLSSELDAIPLVITLLAPKLIPFYGLLYLAINIPLIVIFFRKLKRKFMFKTMYFLFVSTALSCIFFIPNVQDTVHNFITPENTVTIVKWPMFVLPGVGGAVVGIAIALAWKYGGSTGGADIVVYYFSSKKQKDVGSVMFLVSLVIMSTTFGVLIGVDEDIRKAWLPAMLGSLIYIIVLSTMMNLIFPKYHKVQIEIHSYKIDDIVLYLNQNHNHPFRIEDATSGYLERGMKYITTVILVMELKDFQRKIRELDDSAWISATPVSNVFGRFNTSSVDNR